jgi:hypothetical protein
MRPRQGRRRYRGVRVVTALPGTPRIFIDNSSENLRVAAGVGRNVIHFDDGKNDVGGLMQQLRATYGLPVRRSSA